MMLNRLALLATAMAALVLAPPARAQEPPSNAELVGHWPNPGTGLADVWGAPGLAFVAHFGDAGFHIVDISNPQTPVTLNHFRLGSPNTGASAQDIKSAGDLLFVGLEGGSSDSAIIVDIRDPASPQRLSRVDIPGFAGVHNVFFAADFLYLVNSSTTQIAIVDLTGYDPNNPPALITTPRWIVNNVGSSFVHDITVVDGRMYAAAWDSGIWIYDVSQVATQPPTLLGSAPGENTHSCWVTGDNRFVVTGEERGGGGIKVYEITENGPSVDVTLRDEFTVASSRAFSVHNQVVIGHRVYNSWYQTGLQVFDVDPATGLLSLVASFDTNSATGGGGGLGAWGVYPLNGPHQVLIADVETGLWVLNVDLNCAGDVNGDGIVDLADLGILLAEFGCTGGVCLADLDGDGDTDLADLGILLAGFGQPCS